LKNGNQGLRHIDCNCLIEKPDKKCLTDASLTLPTDIKTLHTLSKVLLGRGSEHSDRPEPNKLASVSLPLIFLVISGNESIESASSYSYSTLWQGTCNAMFNCRNSTTIYAEVLLTSWMIRYFSPTALGSSPQWSQVGRYTSLAHKSLYCSCN
jgi:hypothetical protein